MTVATVQTSWRQESTDDPDISRHHFGETP